MRQPSTAAVEGSRRNRRKRALVMGLLSSLVAARGTQAEQVAATTAGALTPKLAAGSAGPTSPPSAADAISAPWGRYRSVVAFDLGLGSAVGLIGLTYAFSPVPWLETEIGLGRGITGTQYSAMQKFTLGAQRTHFVAGVGVSRSSGGYETVNGDTDHGPIWWLNFDLLGFEIRGSGHAVFFLVGGATATLGPEMSRLFWDCERGPNACGPGHRIFPQARAGVGGWF